MLQNLPKKTLIIGATLVVLIFLSVGYYLNISQKQKPLLKPLVTSNETIPTQTPTVKTLNYTDPLGYTFSYPDNLVLNNHPEDQTNYSNVELLSSDKKNDIKFLVADTNFSDINDWATKDQSVKDGNSLDSKLGSLTAKKVFLSSANKIVLGAIWNGMLLTVEVSPADDKSVLTTMNTMLTSLNLPDQANYTNAGGSDTTNTSDTSGGDSSQEEVVE